MLHLPPSAQGNQGSGIAPDLTLLPPKTLPPNSLEERELIPKCTKMCVLRIYIYETQNGNFKIMY